MTQQDLKRRQRTRRPTATPQPIAVASPPPPVPTVLSPTEERIARERAVAQSNFESYQRSAAEYQAKVNELTSKYGIIDKGRYVYFSGRLPKGVNPKLVRAEYVQARDRLKSSRKNAADELEKGAYRVNKIEKRAAYLELKDKGLSTKEATDRVFGENRTKRSEYAAERDAIAAANRAAAMAQREAFVASGQSRVVVAQPRAPTGVFRGGKGEQVIVQPIGKKASTAGELVRNIQGGVFQPVQRKTQPRGQLVGVVDRVASGTDEGSTLRLSRRERLNVLDEQGRVVKSINQIPLAKTNDTSGTRSSSSTNLRGTPDSRSQSVLLSTGFKKAAGKVLEGSPIGSLFRASKTATPVLRSDERVAAFGSTLGTMGSDLLVSNVRGFGKVGFSGAVKPVLKVVQRVAPSTRARIDRVFAADIANRPQGAFYKDPDIQAAGITTAFLAAPALRVPALITETAGVGFGIAAAKPGIQTLLSPQSLTPTSQGQAVAQIFAGGTISTISGVPIVRSTARGIRAADAALFDKTIVMRTGQVRRSVKPEVADLFTIQPLKAASPYQYPFSIQSRAGRVGGRSARQRGSSKTKGQLRDPGKSIRTRFRVTKEPFGETGKIFTLSGGTGKQAALRKGEVVPTRFLKDTQAPQNIPFQIIQSQQRVGNSLLTASVKGFEQYQAQLVSLRRLQKGSGVPARLRKAQQSQLVNMDRIARDASVVRARETRVKKFFGEADFLTQNAPQTQLIVSPKASTKALARPEPVQLAAPAPKGRPLGDVLAPKNRRLSNRQLRAITDEAQGVGIAPSGRPVRFFSPGSPEARRLAAQERLASAKAQRESQIKSQLPATLGDRRVTSVVAEQPVVSQLTGETSLAIRDPRVRQPPRQTPAYLTGAKPNAREQQRLKNTQQLKYAAWLRGRQEERSLSREQNRQTTAQSLSVALAQSQAQRLRQDQLLAQDQLSMQETLSLQTTTTTSAISQITKNRSRNDTKPQRQPPRERAIDPFRPRIRERPRPRTTPGEEPKRPLLDGESDFFGLKGKKKADLVQAFSLYIKRRGEFSKAAGGLTRAEAINLGAKRTKASLAATFQLREENRLVRAKNTRIDPTLGKYFRDYQVRGGKRVALKNTFIERRNKRLVTKAEISELQRARKGKTNSYFKRGKL